MSHVFILRLLLIHLCFFVSAGNYRFLMGSGKRDYRGLRYKCQYCFYATNRPSHLKRHYLTHTQERPFSCAVCGKSFNQKVSLQEHSRIHTGEKPFQCEFCSVRFTQRSSLKNHRRVHLKNDNLNEISFRM